MSQPGLAPSLKSEDGPTHGRVFARFFRSASKHERDDNNRDEKAKGGLAWVLAGLSPARAGLG